MIRRRVECGIDIVTDGEQSKPSFNAYLTERLTGFEPVASSEERVAARMKTDTATRIVGSALSHRPECQTVVLNCAPAAPAHGR